MPQNLSHLEWCGCKKLDWEEKQTEISLAIDLVQYALADLFDVAILVSGDSDFIPVARLLKRLEKRLWNVFAHQSELSDSCGGRLRTLHELAPDFFSLPGPARRSSSGRAELAVFLVHGRDPSGIRNQIAGFLRALNIEPIILQAQPDSDWTLFKEFERHAARSAYAIVLATPDDVGGLKDGSKVSARVRQNVLFEAGYFCSSLGPRNVKLIVPEGAAAEDLELWSDYLGVRNIHMKYKWKEELAAALGAAGLHIDPARLTQALLE